ncbi:DUF4252 domain-containing protein [Aureibaculum sp. 2210JD6-5]|uniref:DUF4252 domain-containing protein n=1 Tax=Aureibaculum sp. 2210JD6-5 TaxID=3103957 RepID=UPI002AAD130A|nr:DUF4252 domain-containing protein [Aureibaculum sp. 2210JD6-5]MDY7394030.1 DUF4252 domain-containing protein [Aureibaculum sp. 2210JD6-5]
MKNINNKMKTKNLIIALALVLTPLFTFAQTTFDKFAEMDDVSVVTVNKKMFELMTKVSGETQEAKEYISLVSSLDNLRVLATENASIAADMKAKVTSYLKSSNLSELMSVKDKEGNVKIYIKEGKDSDHVKELFMFVDGISANMGGEDRKPEAVIVSITGDIDLNKISELTKQMNIQGGEHLKDLKKKN